ncbi:MAG TPA: HAMP domain-containing sensor histidine kinase [Capillimicrobium sp.]|nr:HAMP domain-containing sensor histidine kinase [Capillimicrobium sp.]
MIARGLALVVAATGAAIAIAGAAYGGEAAWLTLATLLPLGLATVVGVRVLARARGRLGGLRRQLLAAGALIVVQLLAGVLAFAAFMLVSAHDVLFVVMVAVYAALLGAWAGWALADGALRDVGAVRAGLAAIGDGRRDLAIETAASDELGQLARDVERVGARLGAEEQARDAAERARRDLLAAVSHDLRTPITSIQLLAEAIDDEVVDAPTRREYGARIAVHARALSALIDDLFELSRLEAGDVRFALEHLPVAELVAGAVDEMREQALARGVDVRVEVPADGALARANPERIQRVLRNLLQNAIRHTPADGSIVVRAEPLGERVEIEVADTGSGIPPDERERVFVAFAQGAADASRSDGAGLGLSIARAIVEAHGGRIWLADAPAGTRVRFSLPSAA